MKICFENHLRLLSDSKVHHNIKKIKKNWIFDQDESPSKIHWFSSFDQTFDILSESLLIKSNISPVQKHQKKPGFSKKWIQYV